MKKKKYLTTVLIICLLAGSVLLPAADLSSYIEAALKDSLSSRMNDLQRTVSTLQLERSELDQQEDGGIAISSGDVSIAYGMNQTSDQIISLDPSVTISLYDYEASVSITAPTTLNATDLEVSSTPKISLQKKIVTYEPEEDTTLGDLEAAAAQMDIDRTYYSGLLSIEKNVLQSVKEILILEKSILVTENNIINAEQDLENDLKTGSVKSGSTAWNLKTNSIIRMNNSLIISQANLEAARDDFQEITGMKYESLIPGDMIQPEISLTAPELGNTKVLAAALDVEIASQKLADELSSRESSVIGDSSFTYLISGSYTAGLNQPVGTYDHTLQAGVTASNSDLVIEAGVSTVIDSTGLTPTVYISGRWTDQPDNREAFDVLSLSILESQVSAVGESYNYVYAQYMNDIQSLQLRISSWNISRAELDLEYDENTLKLEDADYAYLKSFGTAGDVQDAQHELQVVEYNRMLLNIDGMLIERDIKILKL